MGFSQNAAGHKQLISSQINIFGGKNMSFLATLLLHCTVTMRVTLAAYELDNPSF